MWLFILDHLDKNKSGSNGICESEGGEKTGLWDSQAAGGSSPVIWLSWSQDHRAVSSLTPFALHCHLCALGTATLTHHPEGLRETKSKRDVKVLMLLFTDTTFGLQQLFADVC